MKLRMRIMWCQFLSQVHVPSYTDSNEIKGLFRTAKQSKCVQDWKIALRARTIARKEWKARQLERIFKGDSRAWIELKRQTCVGFPFGFPCELQRKVLEQFLVDPWRDHRRRYKDSLLPVETFGSVARHFPCISTLRRSSSVPIW